ncbi:MAG: PorV/PorQ family protein [Caldisericaceae bacterium]|nr:PorV/PorQ family protein [Caldisericaceae bacterium]
MKAKAKLKNKNLLALLVVLFAFYSSSLAQFRKAGTTGYVFLEIPTSARVSAMGETSVALTDAGAASLLTNPSLLAFSEYGWNLYASSANYLADIKHQTAAIGFRLGTATFAGLSLNFMDFGKMTHTINADPENPGGSYLILGDYTADAYALGLSFSRKLTQFFAFGLKAKYVRERIDTYSSDNVLLDMGMVYQTRFRTFRLGGYIQNFGIDAKYIGDSFKMPMIFRLGCAMELFGNQKTADRLTIAVDALHPSDFSERLHIGSELLLRKVLLLRAGYKFNYDEEGLTAGAGLRWAWQQYGFSLDMGYTDFGRLGSVLRFGLSIHGKN